MTLSDHAKALSLNSDEAISIATGKPVNHSAPAEPIYTLSFTLPDRIETSSYKGHALLVTDPEARWPNRLGLRKIEDWLAHIPHMVKFVIDQGGTLPDEFTEAQ